MNDSGRYHFKPDEVDVELDTEPPPPEARAYERISWQADSESEALALDYLVKAYKRMPTEKRVLLIEIVKSWDTLP